MPFYKNKGDARCCSNYRGIKLTAHCLKIWERILDARLRNITNVTENQFGFVSGKSTTDAIHTLRTLVEKHKYNKKNLYSIFIDLEKAFDRVPRELIWQSLRYKLVPEALISLVQDTYLLASTQVKSVSGLTEKFEVKVGVHQGSALSPLLFNLVIDFLTRDIQDEIPWTLLYADDVALLSDDPVDLQGKLNRWTETLE